MAADNQPRRRGKYAHVTACDGCGKSAGYPDHCTDDEVCAGSDGPGFFLCKRPKCPAMAWQDLPVEERRKLYTAQREKNDAKERARRERSRPAQR